MEFESIEKQKQNENNLFISNLDNGFNDKKINTHTHRKQKKRNINAITLGEFHGKTCCTCIECIFMSDNV